MMYAHNSDVRVVDSGNEFASLAGEWEKLQSDADPTSVFAGFEWMYLWWKTYGKGKPLRLLVARENNRIVGLLPLYIDTLKMLKFPVRCLRLIGTGGDTFPDYLGPVLAKGREKEVSRALAKAVLQLRGWDVLLLHDMNPALAFVSEMTEAAKTAYMQPLIGRSERIAFMELLPSWDAWLGAMHRDKRYRIKNIRKKINAAHPTKFFVWKDEKTLDQGIDRLIWLHNKRWEQAGQQHAFSTNDYRDFHRALMHALLKRDQLRLYCLELSGQIVAMYYFYKFRDAVYLMQSGFDPDFSDVKPGQALLGYIVENAMVEGNKVLDFLRGDHRYKDELATGERETVYLTAFRPRPGSLVYVARRMILPRVKAYLLEQLKKYRPEKPANG
jgi:CelD/BcsL family acetyltransferase involved in cellulose biosynthesis